MYSLGCKGLSNDDVQVAGGTVSPEIPLGAGLENVDIARKELKEGPQNDSQQAVHARISKEGGCSP